jgi:hypothetical protein
MSRIKYLDKTFKTRFRKAIALFLVFTLVNQIVFPTYALALTGGPSQPEVQSFTPVGTSDMVDPFSGAFTYNIPLMDVEGYPVNIAYHSGVTMDQESSWVGLGWNINPGVINRTVRGIPDDFAGDPITREFNIKANQTYGLNTGAGLEIVGLDKLHIGASFSVGIKYNNYTGVGIEKSLNLSISVGNPNKSTLNGSLGIKSSSDDGLTITPSVGMSATISEGDTKTNLGLHVGTSINSREGMKSLSIGASVSQSANIGQQAARSGESGKGRTEYKDRPANADVGSKGATAVFDFGQPTYTPNISMPMENFSLTGNFKLGLEFFTVHPNFTIGGYYSEQRLSTNSITSPAYGYLHSDEGQSNENAMMDFNREKDGSFNESTPALPLTNYTFDVYSVSGQGVGGSYRPVRGDIGHVYDPTASSTSSGYSIGGELGLGNLFHLGVDLTVNDVNTTTGRWSQENDALPKLRYHSPTNTGDPLYEKVYFREANEKSVDSDPAFLAAKGGTDAVRIEIDRGNSFYAPATDQLSNGTKLSAKNYRSSRDRRDQEIAMISRSEMAAAAVDDPSLQNLSTLAKPSHIGEVTTYSNDGKRYVYGIAAYNTTQEETTFAVGDDADGNGGNFGSVRTGLVKYHAGTDNTLSNVRGTDNYFSKTTTPAFAHSFLLTEVLSADYVDSDNQRGPSDGDLGDYTKFSYDKVSNYKWRVPCQKDSASFNEGLKWTNKDDKGNYLYGEKELWYLSKIETKNYVAIFTTESRADARGVIDRDGGVDQTGAASRLLRKISLYTKPNYNAHAANNSVALVPIKEVHFEYDYSLCKGVPNFFYDPATNKDPINDSISSDHTGGKLSLKRIYFTYQNSNKARLSPYVFNYWGFNPDYNMKSYDRWGCYKPNTSSGIPASEFSYVEQDKAKADKYTSAWTLDHIQLPSGGTIGVNFESNDYAYVQNKAAMQMFLVDHSFSSASANLGGNSLKNNPKFYFPLQKDENGNYITDIHKYIDGLNLVYFRFLINIAKTFNEYVSGYAPIDPQKCGVDLANHMGYIQYQDIDIDSDKHINSYSPVLKAGIQFARMNTPKLAWGQPAIADNSQFGKQVLDAMVNSNFLRNIQQYLDGPNLSLYNDGRATSFIQNQSWMRLNNPVQKKIGGGCRVKSISMSDAWDGMTASTEKPFAYGQEYSYVTSTPDKRIISSGVASYEPQAGGDENPWKMPVFFEEKKLLVPDDNHYMEEPFGECFFPSPSVGYSRVMVRNLQRQNVHRHATGSVIHEFYTSKDYPTITQRTDIVPKRDKSDPLSLASLFQTNVKDYMTATQGFKIELNDMNGKPRSQSVYQEGQTQPITSVEYYYKDQAYQADSRQLVNSATVVNKDGTVGTANIGITTDLVSDFRQSETYTNSIAVQMNLDEFMLLLYPVFVFTAWPNFTSENTQFRSVVTTKVVQRFGLLDSTVAKDLSSVVTTKNLAYDAETGDILLSRTATDYNDAVYSMSYPAHWYYDGMGQAYKNIGTRINLTIGAAGTAAYPNASMYFAEGDEVSVNNSTKAWVIQANPGSVVFIDKAGAVIPAGSAAIKIIRSGRRNQHSTPIAKLTSLSNPLQSLSSNSYDKVLQASATEFTNRWRTYCDCFQLANTGTTNSTNPYVLGTKGFYKPQKSYLHLTDRTQDNYDNNTNIRRDGVFTAYMPFYKLAGGKWVIDGQNWTYTSEVTQYSAFGPELENKDALGRYSAAEFGYNQTFATAVAANSKYQDLGFDGFEDYDFSKCADNHFKFTGNAQNITNTQSHTGRRSIKVSQGSPVSMIKQLAPGCTTPPDCMLDACYTRTSNGSIQVTVTGYSGNFTVEWEVVSGTANVTLNATGVSIGFNPPSASVNLTITDSKGCTITKHIVLTRLVDQQLTINGISSCLQ